MGMVVRSNIMAVNAQRQLGMNNSQVSKALEKLSSGYRINRAGDDASGLAISEKMKSQIKGLDTASLNAQDGISLVQTAEGALTEVHNMLNRMTELATRSANGINADLNREALQKEVDKLQSEIDRISESTNFNGIKLLDGSLGGGSSSAVKNAKIDGITLTDVDATKHKADVAAPAKKNFTANAVVGDFIDLTVTYTENGQEKATTLKVSVAKNDQGKFVLRGDSGKEYAVAGLNATTAAAPTTQEINDAFAGELKESGLQDKFKVTGDITNGFTFEAKEAGANGAAIVGVSSENQIDGTASTAPASSAISNVTKGEDAYVKGMPTAYDGTNADKAVFSVNGKKYVVAVDGTDVSGLDKDVKVIFGADTDAAGENAAAVITEEVGLNVTYDTTDGLIFKAGEASISGNGLVLQIGDTADSFNQITVNINDMSSKGIGVGNVDISSREGAASAIDTIRNAIDAVSDQRAELGATQNRLEYTINNLDTASENLQSANSRIRDTDMAKMMMEYTKVNVLTQSAQAMLAQANQQPQSVLQLLQ